MLSIGWVMFWKALILGLGALGLERYRHYRRDRIIDLKQNRAGVYVPDDRLERAERWVKRGLNLGFYLMLIFWAALAYLLFLRPDQ